MLTPAELGAWYKDIETGFVGKATQICFNLHGSTQVHLENHHSSRWFEIERIERNHTNT